MKLTPEMIRQLEKDQSELKPIGCPLVLLPTDLKVRVNQPPFAQFAGLFVSAQNISRKPAPHCGGRRPACACLWQAGSLRKE